MEKSPTEIIVRGAGEARALPDRAILQVTIDADGSSRDDAYGNAAPAAKAVDQLLESYAEAIENSSAAALVVHPRTRYRRGETVRTGWRARRTSVVEVADLEQLGSLIAELTAADGAVVGPSWQLDPTNSVHAEARRLAAEDARRRAEVYASALGVGIGGIAWIAEPGLRENVGGAQFTGPMRTMAAVAAGAEPADEDVIDVTPDEITVTAEVEVGFELDPE